MGTTAPSTKKSSGSSGGSSTTTKRTSGSGRASATKSDSDVAAVAEGTEPGLGGPNQPEGQAEEANAEKVAAQEAQQAAELKAGKAQGKTLPDLTELSMVEQREGAPRDAGGPVGGLVDNMSKRDDSDVLEGHFCRIDYGNYPDAAKMVKEQLAPKGSGLEAQGFEPGVGSADYGVYLQPGSRGEDGYPETALVHLRDEHAAFITVPYASLKPAQAGAR